MSEQPESPARERGWAGVWAGLLWFLVTLGVILAGQWVASAMADKLSGGRHVPMTDGDVLTLTYVVALPVMLVVLVPGVKLWRDESVRAWLAIEAVSVRRILVWCALMLAVLALYMASGAVSDRPQVPEWMLDTWRTVDNRPAFFVAVAVLGPLLEELAFRGYILRAFEVSILGARVGAVAVSFLWAAIHLQYDLFDASWIFVFGLVLAAARLKTGSLLTPFFLHALWNGISTVSVFWYLK